jgi:hypothetical protein
MTLSTQHDIAGSKCEVTTSTGKRCLLPMPRSSAILLTASLIVLSSLLQTWRMRTAYTHPVITWWFPSCVLSGKKDTKLNFAVINYDGFQQKQSTGDLTFLAIYLSNATWQPHWKGCNPMKSRPEQSLIFLSWLVHVKHIQFFSTLKKYKKLCNTKKHNNLIPPSSTNVQRNISPPL